MVLVGELIWRSIPNDYDQISNNSNLGDSLVTAGSVLSIATNGITTIMIAYKLWYVAVGGTRWIQWLTITDVVGVTVDLL